MFRVLGNTSVKLPLIGQGTTRVGSYADATPERDRQRMDALRFGIDLGLNFLDTAQLYGGGHSEEVVGQAIKGLRDKVFLASKFNPEYNSYQKLVKAVDKSLDRLQTDYLDLYQVHFPNSSVRIEETMGAMEDLVVAGKIRHIGVSNFTLAELMTARAASSPIGVVSIQVEYNLFQRSIEQDLLPYCQQEEVTVLAYSPLDQGFSVGEGPRLRTLRSLAEKYGKTASQITLRWLVSRPSVVVLVKAARREHILENAQSLEFDLLDEDIERIDQTFDQQVFHACPSRIRTGLDSARSVYRTIEEALENRFDLIPSPESFAQNVAKGNFLKPLPLVPTKDTSGAFDYDLVDGQVFFWAWVIAKGLDEPMPVFEKRG